MSSDSQPGHLVDSINYMNAALYEAAEKGKFEVFENYQMSELESLRTPDNNTVLHVHLAARGNLDLFKFIAEILLKCPSLLLQANNRGQTPLHVAARYAHPLVVKFLTGIYYINAREDPEQQQITVEAVRRMLRMTDLESNTPLHIAVRYRGPRMVKELLEFEDPDFPYSINRKQESPLYIAARRGHERLLDMILGKLKLVAHGGPHGRTALHAAAMAGDAKATRIILEKRRSLTKERDEDGHTPLHYAAHLGHFSVVKVLLKWDISAAYVTDKKREMTPLLMAARQGHGQIVAKFLSACPDCCEIVDKTGWNFLHFVAFRDSPDTLRDKIFKHGLLFSQSGSVKNLIDAEDDHGITPQQVYDTFNAPRKKNKSNEKMEQIEKLLEHIVNEQVAETPVRPIPMLSISTDGLEKAREAHLVVGALIATVAFTAAIAVPGGYKSSGKEHGTPFLIHDVAFQAFVVTDALAFIFSLSAVALHFDKLSPFASSSRDASSHKRATTLLGLAILTIMLAFSTGTYVVLKPSPRLAITTCCIGLSFIFYDIVTSIF